MFTGLVEGMGWIASRRGGAGDLRLGIRTPFEEAAVRGESIAVDGVCLTVVAARAKRFEAVVSPETLARTTLGHLAEGDTVNLERALRLGDRVGGHLVQGHVDATTRILETVPEGEGRRMRVALPPDLERYVVEKGSIAVDGVSLTIAARAPGVFEVALIPATLEATGLGRKSAGAPVNLEVDQIGRYVIQALETRLPARGAGGAITRELLERQGFSLKEVVS